MYRYMTVIKIFFIKTLWQYQECIWQLLRQKKNYTDVVYGTDSYIMFGKESAGIPEEILVESQETAIRIPMCGDIRSLNLSNAVAVVLYEALRQNNFPGMETEGQLHYLNWKM